MLISLKQL